MDSSGTVSHPSSHSYIVFLGKKFNDEADSVEQSTRDEQHQDNVERYSYVDEELQFIMDNFDFHPEFAEEVISSHLILCIVYE